MNQTQQHCSTPDPLLTFLRGQLTSQEESELQLHLNDCVLCRERLENAAADANAWNEAKQFFGNGALHGSTDDSTNGHEETTQGSQRIRQVLDTLAPTDDPESLGRIGGYEVTGVVGAGGMGVVLKAHDRSLDRIVAVKVMSPHLAETTYGVLHRIANDNPASVCEVNSDVPESLGRIIQGDEVVKSLTVSKQGATTRIEAGRYIVEIGQKFDKAVIKEGGVELSRGATAIAKVTQANADTAVDEKSKDEAAKAWLRRPVVGSTHDGHGFKLTGHDALMYCVLTNNSKSLNRLLAMDKYDLDLSPDNGQWTLLQNALLQNCVETTSLLLSHGANPNIASKGTPLPLELAQQSGRKDLVALVKKYLDVRSLNTHTKVDEIE